MFVQYGLFEISRNIHRDLDGDLFGEIIKSNVDRIEVSGGKVDRAVVDKLRR